MRKRQGRPASADDAVEIGSPAPTEAGLLSGPRRWATAVAAHGTVGVVVYHAVHYGLWVLLFAAFFALSIDIIPVVRAAATAAGWGPWFDAMIKARGPAGAAHVVSAYLSAFIVNKLLVPFKVLVTIRIARAVATWRRRRQKPEAAEA